MSKYMGNVDNKVKQCVHFGPFVTSGKSSLLLSILYELPSE